jgi:hypothetical protein
LDHLPIPYLQPHSASAAMAAHGTPHPGAPVVRR